MKENKGNIRVKYLLKNDCKNAVIQDIKNKEV